MEIFLSTIVYVSLAVILYVYIGYPFVLCIFAKLFAGPQVKKSTILPTVTMIISCYNEEEVLVEKLQNTVRLDYPKELIELLVVSDGSTDRTDKIAFSFRNQGVKLIRQEGRLGKTMGLNLAIRQATGEIVVFSDANAIYQNDAIRKMIGNFADESVGYVVGQAQYFDPGLNSASRSENTYWNYETFIKTTESSLHSVVGGDGAIYAIRKELYEELLQTDINDFVNPLQIIAKGFRGIYEPSAIAVESAAGSFSKEFSRKVRIVNRAFTGLLRVKESMDPRKTGFFAFQIISHKLLRWLIPFFLISLGISSFGLALLGNYLGQILQALIIISTFFALLGWYMKDKEYYFASVFSLAYYFAVVNLAALHGVVKSLKGDVQVTWETVRSFTDVEIIHNKTVLVLFCITPLVLLLLFFTTVLYLGLTVALIFMFWLALSIISYVYFGYPLILYFWSKIAYKENVKDNAVQPSVTLLVCAYNEEDVISEKIENSLDLDYPTDKIKIIIASDGSTDKTTQIINTFEDERLTLYSYNQRRGKIKTIIETVPEISSEIIVFSDANTMYARDSIRKLTRNFADPCVGAVSGDVSLQNEQTSFGVSESTYYIYERWIQLAESHIGSIVGADGAMYAIRRDLFMPPSMKTILDDFVISMNVTLQNYRVVYDPEAQGFEENIISHKFEFLRKSRIVAGGLQSVFLCEGIPSFAQPKLLFCYLSHKLLRWLIPCHLLLFFASNAILSFSSEVRGFRIALALQCAFYCCALLGYFSRRMLFGRFFAIPFYFCLVNGAALYGIYKGIFNKQSVTWEVFARK